MIKNIVLDVGKVLVAWEPDDAMKRLGFSVQEIDAVTKAIFTSKRWVQEDLGILSDEELLESFVAEAPEYKTQIEIFWNNVNMAIWQLPYVKDWISSMKKAGYGVYILSNYGRHTYAKTKEDSLDFLTLTDGAIFSNTVNVMKPDAAIYQTLCERYQLNPTECVFVDDLPANVAGAKKVGMQGIVFTGYEAAIEKLKEMGVEF